MGFRVRIDLRIKMKKQMQVLIKTGKDKFIPVGTAEVELHTEMASFGTAYELSKVELNRLDINVKKGDTLWEKIKENIFE